MIEQLSPRIHFAVFGPDLSYDDGLPDVTNGASERFSVSGGKTLAVFKVPIPLKGYYDEQQQYTTRFSRYFSDGTLDTTFGRKGYLDVGITSQVKYVPGLRLLVVAEDGQVVRAYTLNGRVDTSFSDDGVASIPTGVKIGGSNVLSEAELEQVLDDGRLLVRASVAIVEHQDIKRLQTIARLNVDGSVDTTFARSGLLSFRQDEGFVENVLLTPSALYIHINYGYLTTPPTGELIRISPDGKTADKNFDVDGRLTIAPFASNFTEQPDGKLLYVESTYGQSPVLYRLNTDGTPDTTFSGDGKIALTDPDSESSTGGTSLFLDDQGRITISEEDTIFRFSSTGAIDAYPFNGTATFPTGVVSIDEQDRVLATDGRRYGMVLPQQLNRDGIVEITTDYGDDVISISDAANFRIRVVVNGESKLFRARDVREFNVKTFGGDLEFKSLVGFPVTLTGAAGDADVTLGGGNDTIELGAGDHTIDLGAGDDLLRLGETPPYNATSDPNYNDRHTVVSISGSKSVQILSGSANIDLGSGDHNVGTYREAHDNTINIVGGNNTVYLGGDGNDVLNIGENGANDITVFGKDCDITTGVGPDKVLAISPYGTIRTTGGNDVVTIRTFGENPTRGVTVHAGSGNDHVFCDPGYNSLATVYGGPGDDLLDGAALAQRFYGENGNDTLIGGGGSDILYGGDMNDRLIGGDASDRLFGEAGDDTLHGQAGADKLYGGDGNDYLFAERHHDELFGDAGNDRLYTLDAHGLLTLRGGAGDDRFFTRNGRDDTLFGDGGNDLADADDVDVLVDITRA